MTLARRRECEQPPVAQDVDPHGNAAQRDRESTCGGHGLTFVLTILRTAPAQASSEIPGALRDGKLDGVKRIHVLALGRQPGAQELNLG